ncbi:hypothetical protein CLIB1423_02S10792 [[Candida] railenensis]|uniref:LicD/FKTN/FKRP nucleotidyltransferase domain-containing protein n=1 Tax=[Candida] railenensis TaxID=45579 RepID=A0A9P0QM51_9ASCO|nr:hypothetical protein CLIB1423_02S10792 [[Candida] railenensis]
MIVSRRHRRVSVLLLVLGLCTIGMLFTETGQDFVDKVVGTSVSDMIDYDSHSGGSFIDKLNAVVEPLKEKDTFLKYMLDVKAQIDTKIKLPKYLIDEKDQSPRIQTFDPRFTLGLLFHDLSRQIGTSKRESREEQETTNNNDDTETKEEAGISSYDLNVKYFHWADWRDLSRLDQYIFSDEPFRCDDIFKVFPAKKEQEVYNPVSYCINDDDLEYVIKDKHTDAKLKAKLQRIADNPQSSSKFHIFQYSGRTTQDRRLVHGNSYLNDFMDPPQKILFLIQNTDDDNQVKSRGIIVNVNQDLKNRERLINTPIIEDYINEVRSIDPDKDVFIDAKEQFNKFNTKLGKSNSKDTSVNPSIELTSDLFEDDSKNILAGLNKQKKELGSLSASDELYRASLEFSSNPDTDSFKYFSEAKLLRKEKNWAFGAHYDWRFFNGVSNGGETMKPSLFGLIKAWLQLTQTYEIKTWIAHGSLLSWYWNGISFPWDFDIDVQVPIADLHKISQMFNQSLIVDLGEEGESYSGTGVRYGRYFLDCGTFISRRDRGKGENNIDARFIDVDTGAYIDITALALSETKASSRYVTKDLPESGFPSEYERNKQGQLYNCRNNHFSSLSELNPLRLTLHDGVPAYIVNNYENILIAEYRKKGIVEKIFKTKVFLQKIGLYADLKKLQSWTKSHQPDVPIPQGSIDAGFRNYRSERNFDPFRKWSDDHWVEYLKSDTDLLMEYLMTHELTEFHRQELKQLESGKSTEAMLVDNEGNLKFKYPEIRHDYWSYMEAKEHSTFDVRVSSTLNKYKEWKSQQEEHPKSSLDQILAKAKEMAEEKKIL